jgi:hypothetical protein
LEENEIYKVINLVGGKNQTKQSGGLGNAGWSKTKQDFFFNHRIS